MVGAYSEGHRLTMSRRDTYPVIPGRALLRGSHSRSAYDVAGLHRIPLPPSDRQPLLWSPRHRVMGLRCLLPMTYIRGTTSVSCRSRLGRTHFLNKIMHLASTGALGPLREHGAAALGACPECLESLEKSSIAVCVNYVMHTYKRRMLESSEDGYGHCGRAVCRADIGL